jgi:hypothetical protein
MLAEFHLPAFDRGTVPGAAAARLLVIHSEFALLERDNGSAVRSGLAVGPTWDH